MGAVLLLFVSAAWGSAFPLMKDLTLRMSVADLLTERYGLAVLVLLLIRPRCLRNLAAGTWSRGITLGLVFGVGQTAQAIALQSLPSAVSGFAVGCNVVMTPVLGLLLLGTQVSRRIWAAVALSAVAMAVFTLLRGLEGGDISVLALSATLVAAALYAGHTLMLGKMAQTSMDGYAVTVIQLGTIATLTAVLAVPGGLTLPAVPADWAVLGHLAVVSCALGFLARTFGQAHVPAVPAAVILSSQPLWVAGLAVVAYGEPLTWSMVLGGGLVGLAMLLVVIPGRPREAKTVELSAESREQLLRVRWRASEVLLCLQEERDREEELEDPLPEFFVRPRLPQMGPPPATGLSQPLVPREPPDDRLVDQVVQRAIAVVRDRTTPDFTESCAPFIAVVGGQPLVSAEQDVHDAGGRDLLQDHETRNAGEPGQAIR
jgi:drug/metabolite transporter (DMT)-like permease